MSDWKVGRPRRSAGFDRLDAVAAAKVTVATLRLEAGNTSNVKSLGGGLSEIRIDWVPGYRV